jgi:hypothetical protein
LANTNTKERFPIHAASEMSNKDISKNNEALSDRTIHFAVSKQNW